MAQPRELFYRRIHPQPEVSLQQAQLTHTDSSAGFRQFLFVHKSSVVLRLCPVCVFQVGGVRTGER